MPSKSWQTKRAKHATAQAAEKVERAERRLGSYWTPGDIITDWYSTYGYNGHVLRLDRERGSDE